MVILFIIHHIIHLKEDSFTFTVSMTSDKEIWLICSSIKEKNNNFNYILTVIDCLSKYAWCIPSKDKTGNEIINAFTHLFKNTQPKKLQTDTAHLALEVFERYYQA